MQTVQAHIYIKGDVIGVGFRAWTKIQAKIAGITGWVRNTYDKSDIFGTSGGVEAVICGTEEQLKQFIATIKQGSPIAHVTEVDVLWIEPKHTFENFEIRQTKHTTI